MFKRLALPSFVLACLVAAPLVSQATAAVAPRVLVARPTGEANTTSTTHTIRWTLNVSTGIKSVKCRLDAAAWKACSKSKKLTNVKEGAHVFTVLLTMTSGQTASGGDNWRVDRTAPAVPTITGNSPNGTNKPSVFVAISKDPKGSGVASYSYEVATQTGWGQETTGKTVTIKAEGRTSVRFRARDKAGNFSAWGQAGTWIDTVKPQAPGPPGGGAFSGGVSLTPGISIDPYPGTGVKDYQYQYGPDSAGTITYGTLTTLPSGSPFTLNTEGSWAIRFRAVDFAGNVSPWSVYPFTVSGI